MKEYLKFENPIEAEKKESKEVSTSENIQEQSIVEFAEKTINSIEKESWTLMQQGIQEIDRVNKGIELSAENIVKVEKELDVFDRLKDLEEKIYLLIKQTKERITALIAPEKESEPVITPGEIFDPEAALKRVRKFPKKEQSQELKEFKEKLAYQKEGLARIQEQLIIAIRKNPDASTGQLYEIVRDFGPRYGLTEAQKETAKSMLQTYVEKHKRVREIRGQCPDDDDLWFALFGNIPRGRIEVIEGPMTLYFRCHDIVDYGLIYSQSFLQNRQITQEDERVANMSGGVSVGTSLAKGLDGTIIAENAEGRPFEGYAKGTFLHEEQHAMKKLFREELTKNNALQELKASKTDEEREAAMRHYFQWLRHNEEGRAKDEIFAFLKDGFHSPQDTLKYLTESKEEGGLYDYFANEEEGLIQFLVPKLGEKHKPLIQKTVQQVFVTEYRKFLEDGIGAFTALREEGYSQEQTIALLIKEPLTKWEKVVRRLLKAKE